MPSDFVSDMDMDMEVSKKDGGSDSGTLVACVGLAVGFFVGTGVESGGSVGHRDGSSLVMAKILGDDDEVVVGCSVMFETGSSVGGSGSTVGSIVGGNVVFATGS